MQAIAKKIKKRFEDLFYSQPFMVRSPGRVNLIGEHTDYNEGFVLPAAIDRAIYFAISLRDDEQCHLVAFDLQEEFQGQVSAIQKSTVHWANYLLGVMDQFQKAGYRIPGINCVFGGNIPIAAGLSSSAALEAGLAFALNKLLNLNLTPMELVKLARKAENEFVGVECGVMDQFANLYGKKDQVILLDCRTLEHAYYPFNNADVRIVLCDSQIKRELATSEYNLRRHQCEQSVKVLQQFYPEIRSLRDVTLPMLKEHQHQMDPVLYRRARYVVEENERVLEACKNLQIGDYKALGQLMYESHTGLRDDFEVSCAELDLLVESTHRMDGVLGARLMGAGFGGCTINLVKNEYIEKFQQRMVSIYRDKLHREPRLYITSIEEGTASLNV